MFLLSNLKRVRENFQGCILNNYYSSTASLIRFTLTQAVYLDKNNQT